MRVLLKGFKHQIIKKKSVHFHCNILLKSALGRVSCVWRVEKAVHFYFTNTFHPLYTASGKGCSGKRNVSEIQGRQKITEQMHVLSAVKVRFYYGVTILYLQESPPKNQIIKGLGIKNIFSPYWSFFNAMLCRFSCVAWSDYVQQTTCFQCNSLNVVYWNVTFFFYYYSVTNKTCTTSF